MIKFTSETLPQKKNLILFIHGLTGSEDTWKHSKGVNFPSILAEIPEIEKNFDIATYSYYSKIVNFGKLKFLLKLIPFVNPQVKLNLNVEELAGDLITELETRCNEYEKIVVIAHSLGGLLAKATILKMLERNIPMHIVHFISLAVPHNGANLANIAKLILGNEHIKDLAPLSAASFRLNNDWLQDKTERLPEITYFMGTYDLTVTETSSIGYSVSPQKIKSFPLDHIRIAKPKSKDDTLVLAVKQILLDALNAPEKKKLELKASKVGSAIVIQTDDFGAFNLSPEWFKARVQVSYDEEIRSKFIPVLHYIHDFEKDYLGDIVDFESWIDKKKGDINAALEYGIRSQKHVESFYEIINAEKISVRDTEHPFIKLFSSLEIEIKTILEQLKAMHSVMDSPKHDFAKNFEGFNPFTFNGQPVKIEQIPEIKGRSYWRKFLSGTPADEKLIRGFVINITQFFHELIAVNNLIEILGKEYQVKIIAGPAGAGKTHTSAYLLERIDKNNELVLFFKAKSFSGDHVDMDKKILQLLGVPDGYNLDNFLDMIEDYAAREEKRCYLIIDALNETTKSSIGFSTIWKTALDTLINRIKQRKHLHIVITLRTSYIGKVWAERPSAIKELDGFGVSQKTREACKIYFDYYNIDVTNLQTANLNYFKRPLLLDLCCKMSNPDRKNRVAIELGTESYSAIFKNYVQHVVNAVKAQLNLFATSAITAGIANASDQFQRNNDATINLDDFAASFDPDHLQNVDTSIASAVLEGYLIYIREQIEDGEEVIMHTQQEVGGYLLAKRLLDRFPNREDLVASPEFSEQIIGTNNSLHHQLRLDILKFIIAQYPEILNLLNESERQSLGWEYLYSEPESTGNIAIANTLIENATPMNFANAILTKSEERWFEVESDLNFNLIFAELKKKDNWSFDLTWTFFVDLESSKFHFLIKQETAILQHSQNYVTKDNTLKHKLITLLLASTDRNLRDKATKYLLHLGNADPLELLDLTVQSRAFADSYIYQRLILACYGVALLRQNDQGYVQESLPVIAEKLFSLQFIGESATTVYDFIVTDSIKHLTNLAIAKNVLSLSESSLALLSDYKLLNPPNWVEPSAKQLDLIYSSRETSWPNPIGMDFGIYTIPRLLHHSAKHKERRQAIAQVYKRIYELGYEIVDFKELEDERLAYFIRGSRSGRSGKVDRLGKKYSWKAFFDYAGYRLQQDSNNFMEDEDDKKVFSRPSDVEIDISRPEHIFKTSLEIYPENLLSKMETDTGWTKESRIETIKDFFRQDLLGEEYIMLHGKVDHRPGEDYKTRSFLLVDSFLVVKDAHFERVSKVKLSLQDDWENDVNHQYQNIRHCYFGELYWADTVSQTEGFRAGIPTGEKVTVRYVPSAIHAIQMGLPFEDIGNEIVEERDEIINLTAEPTLCEFLFESDSEVFKQMGEMLPATGMATAIGLVADPLSGQILDGSLRPCFQIIEYRDGFKEHDFNYMRADLLADYMSRNNLALVYQIKQHSYTEQNNDRFMQYVILQ